MHIRKSAKNIASGILVLGATLVFPQAHKSMKDYIDSKKIFASQTPYTEKINESWSKLCPKLEKGFILDKKHGSTNNLELTLRDLKSLQLADICISISDSRISRFSFKFMPGRYNLALSGDTIRIPANQNILETILKRDNPQTYNEALELSHAILDSYQKLHQN